MRRLANAVVLLLAVATVAAAGEPITIGETVVLDSKVMGEPRTVLVSTPPGYARSRERYPVLYLTDGDAHLTHTRGTVDFLVRNGLMPDLIVVGVSNTDRTRDLTPTHAFRTRRDGTREEIAGSGGGDRFLDFFERELVPFVDATYRTTPLRLFSGHSYGGLFALHAFATRPGLFQITIACSPSLDYDDDLVLKTLAAYLHGKEGLDRTLLVSMADEEDGDPTPTRLDRLRGLLAASKARGFVRDTLHLPEETHGSVVLPTQYWGLRTAFADWQLPAGPDGRGFAGTADDIRRHFTALSARYGYPVLPAENLVNQAGYGALARGDRERALAIFRYNVECYPESANVHDSLGEALEGAGRLEEAHASYARAVENAARLGDQRLELFTRNRDRAAAALQAKPDRS